MNSSSNRYKENQEDKKVAKERWEQDTKAQQENEANKKNLRINRDMNISKYQGPETDRLENRDRINKS